MAKRFVIIGGGPAGNQAATHAARLGAEVTLIERDTIGGDAQHYLEWKDTAPLKAAAVAAELNLPPDAVLLDVREDDEWAAGRAPGAVHVPMTQLAERLEEIPEGDPVYVICRSGGRSARVTAYLNSQGWDSVNVAGGMGGWAAAGKPMVADGDTAPEVI